MNKRLHIAHRELEEALWTKDTVLRRRKEEIGIWQNILAQIVEETANGPA